METSIFNNKNNKPETTDLMKTLGNTYVFWNTIRNYVLEKYPAIVEEWNYPGIKYGWSFKMKDKKRAVIYFLPRDTYFKVAFVFGQKATDKIMSSDISEDIKNELMLARVYAEGRGIRIDVKEENVILDIKKLIDIKLAF